VHFHGAFYDLQKNTVNLTLEFVDAGSLEAVLKLGNNKGFLMPTGVIGDLASQVACGLEYLHEHVRVPFPKSRLKAPFTAPGRVHYSRRTDAVASAPRP